jgi:hypothetical protein
VELRFSGDNGGMGKKWSLGLGVTVEVNAVYGRWPNLRLKLETGRDKGVSRDLNFRLI